MKTISNKQLTIQVSPHGAELCSIVANGKEYLWQADPAFWKRHSPVLFPIVGSVWEMSIGMKGFLIRLLNMVLPVTWNLLLFLKKRMKYVTALSAMKKLCINTLFILSGNRLSHPGKEN